MRLLASERSCLEGGVPGKWNPDSTRRKLSTVTSDPR